MDITEDIAEIMKPYRKRIDDLDDQIIDLLAERTGVIREVGRLKHEKNIPSVIQSRVDEVRERAVLRAAKKGLDENLIRQFYASLIDYSCNLEDEIKAELDQKQTAA